MTNRANELMNLMYIISVALARSDETFRCMGQAIFIVQRELCFVKLMECCMETLLEEEAVGC